MILSLPWTSWVLMLGATLVPLALTLKFYLAHRGESDDSSTHP